MVLREATGRGHGEETPSSVVNVASVPHRSLFRYPGGKTWLVPLFRRWMLSLEKKPRVLVEPFAGGGIIGLTTAFEGLADEVLLVELDPQVAAVWETVLGDDADWLAERILSFEFNIGTVTVELARTCSARREIAFQTLLRNRVSHGGILAKGAGLTKPGRIRARAEVAVVSRNARAPHPATGSGAVADTFCPRRRHHGAPGKSPAA